MIKMNAQITSVLGAVSPDSLGIMDAHNHIWISPPSGTPLDAPVLNQQDEIRLELADFRRAGGNALVDCQPGGCGRDGLVLASLSRETGVIVIASTGFHLRKYYPSQAWLWSASCDQAAQYFIGEIQNGLEEARTQDFPVRAGLIKVACEENLEQSPQPLLVGAVYAAIETGKAIEVHTEKGRDAQNILTFLVKMGLNPGQIILCHIDKNPDLGLHKELAQAGVLLEYDTFYRPKYKPELHLWKLISAMVTAGLQNRVALATDMAESALWARLGGGPGLAAFPTCINNRLLEIGLSKPDVIQLMGGNIAQTLGGIT